MATLDSTVTRYEHFRKEPLNCEPPVDELISSFITKSGTFDRNHGPIPHIDPNTHTLTIVIDTTTPSSAPTLLTPADLRTRFPQHEVVAALQCAGNRRRAMRTQRLRPSEVKGVDWGDGAAACCVWRGPRLRDVLAAAGVGVVGVRSCADRSGGGGGAGAGGDDGGGGGCNSAGGGAVLERVDSVVDGSTGGDEGGEYCNGEDGRVGGGGAGGGGSGADGALHVEFACHATACQEASWYGASIPLVRAMSVEDEVVVAVEMNGRPLTAAHGAPVRIVVPGVAGARSVKWVDTITVQPFESRNHYQQLDYKILPQFCIDDATAEKWWSRTPALMDMPINSVVGIPQSGCRVTPSAVDGTIEVRGYALPGSRDGPVRKVEVSGDEGRTWSVAEILEPPEEMGRLASRWAWSLWRARVKVEKGVRRCVWSRATDGRDTQPRFPEWNWRGLAYNGYGEAVDLLVE